MLTKKKVVVEVTGLPHSTLYMQSVHVDEVTSFLFSTVQGVDEVTGFPVSTVQSVDKVTGLLFNIGCGGRDGPRTCVYSTIQVVVEVTDLLLGTLQV